MEQEQATIKKLYITNIEKKDEGRYRCVASVDGRQYEKPVKLMLFSKFLQNFDFPVQFNFSLVLFRLFLLFISFSAI